MSGKKVDARKKPLLENTDAAIGRGVREMVTKFKGDYETETMCAMAAGNILVSLAAKMNAETLKFSINEATYKDRPVGDWKVVVKRVRKPK